MEQVGGPQPAPTPPTINVDELLTLAAHFQSHNAAGFSNGAHPKAGYAGHQGDPTPLGIPGGVPCHMAAPIPHSSSDEGHGNNNSGQAESAAQHALAGAQGTDDGNVPDIQPRMQALLASLQVVLLKAFKQQAILFCGTCVHHAVCKGYLATL